MLTLAIVAILGGAVLGLRYRVFILLPAVMLVLVVVIGVGVARGAGSGRIALDILVALTALQLGYAGGSAFAAARKRHKPHSGDHIRHECDVALFASFFNSLSERLLTLLAT